MIHKVYKSILDNSIRYHGSKTVDSLLLKIVTDNSTTSLYFCMAEVFRSGGQVNKDERIHELEHTMRVNRR